MRLAAARTPLPEARVRRDASRDRQRRGRPGDGEDRKLRRAFEEEREANRERIRTRSQAKLHALGVLWERPLIPLLTGMVP